MNYPGFLGGSAATQSPYANASRLVNLYPEAIPVEGAPTRALLLPTPGFQSFASTSRINTRALCADVPGRLFAVVGSRFVEISATGIETILGTVAEDSNPATIAYSGTTGDQLFICSGSNGYLYILSSGAFSTVLTGDATMGDVKDGRFLALDVTTGMVRMSEINDGATWDPLLFFERSLAADPWLAMLVLNPGILLVGAETSEFWYNSGASPQPYAPITSSFMRVGTSASFSVAKVGSGAVMLGHDRYGSAQIIRIQGYTPQVISTYAVATALSVFDRAGSLNDCETLVYQQEGHTVVNFNFATARSTWSYDLENNTWHERGQWQSDRTSYAVWSPRVHCHAFGKHLVGDRTTGTISEMSVTFGTELNGDPIRRLRIPPPLWANPRRPISVGLLTLRLEAGLGTVSGQGSDPLVSLRVSRDAKTWGPLRWASAGVMGAYMTDVSWNRLGSTRTLFMPEFTMSDPVPWRLSGLDIDASGIEQAA